MIRKRSNGLKGAVNLSKGTGRLNELVLYPEGVYGPTRVAAFMGNSHVGMNGENRGSYGKGRNRDS